MVAPEAPLDPDLEEAPDDEDDSQGDSGEEVEEEELAVAPVGLEAAIEAVGLVEAVGKHLGPVKSREARATGLISFFLPNFHIFNLLICPLARLMVLMVVGLRCNDGPDLKVVGVDGTTMCKTIHRAIALAGGSPVLTLQDVWHLIRLSVKAWDRVRY